MIKKIGDIALVQLSEVDSNIYLHDDCVIDSGTGFNFTRLYTILKTLKKNLSDIKTVINTHAHFDHTGGNGYFLNAKIAIHELDAPVIEIGDMKLSAADYFNGKIKPRNVDIKLKEGDIINFGSIPLKVIHTPGHTPGSICLHNEEKGLLFSGDCIFSDGVGVCDMPGGDESKMPGSLEKLRALKFDKILPGHGDPILVNGKKVLEDILKG